MELPKNGYGALVNKNCCKEIVSNSVALEEFISKYNVI